MEAALPRLVALLAREAGKTLADGVAEVREAADFCRYYAAIAEREFAGAAPAARARSARRNALELHGRGVFVAISPWNFPLSIFTGQVAAALAAGNAVLAKPAEQTPRIAAEAVRLFHAAGLDPRLLALTPGDGEHVGQALIAPSRLRRRRLHRRHRHRLGDQPQARGARRADRPLHRRDRRPQRHVRRHHGAEGAGDRRRHPLGLRLGRPALLGAAGC